MHRLRGAAVLKTPKVFGAAASITLPLLNTRDRSFIRRAAPNAFGGVLRTHNRAPSFPRTGKKATPPVAIHPI